MSVIDEPPPAHEQQFIGRLLRDPSAWDQLPELVDEQNFSCWRCRFVYLAMLKVYISGVAVDEITTRKQLIEDGVFESIGGGPFLFSCYDRVPTGFGVVANARDITESGVQRRLLLSLKRTAEKIERGEYESLEQAIAATGDIPEQFKTYRKSALDILPFNELAQQYPHLRKPVIEGLAREGEVINNIAKSKVGKSWLNYGLALSVVTERPWLDRFPTHKGRVLLIDNELHREDLACRIQTVANAMSIPYSDYCDSLDIWSLRGRLRGIMDIESDIRRIGQPDRREVGDPRSLYRGQPSARQAQVCKGDARKFAIAARSHRGRLSA